MTKVATDLAEAMTEQLAEPAVKIRPTTKIPPDLHELLALEIVCPCTARTTLAEILTLHPRARHCCVVGMNRRKKILDAMAVIHEAVIGEQMKR